MGPFFDFCLITLQEPWSITMTLSITMKQVAKERLRSVRTV